MAKRYTLEDIERIEKDFKSFMVGDLPQVLVIDDSATNRKMITRMLKGLGYTKLQEAKDGMDGLMKLNMIKGPCVVLLDLNMPNMDGYTFLTRIKADPDHKDTPVIIISTETQKTKVVQAIKGGACGYIVKPFSEEALESKLTPVVAEM